MVQLGLTQMSFHIRHEFLDHSVSAVPDIRDEVEHCFSWVVSVLGLTAFVICSGSFSVVHVNWDDPTPYSIILELSLKSGYS